MIKQHFYQPEMAQLFFNFFMVERELASLFNRIYSQHGFTTKQWLVLAVATNIERPTIQNVAKALKTSHQNVKAIALNLEKADLISLVQDTTDKRVKLIVASKKLQNLSVVRGTKDQEGMITLFGGFEAQELKQLLSYTERLLKQIEMTKCKIK